MGKMMNVSDLLKRPFSELTISEQAAVLKAKYEKVTFYNIPVWRMR